MVSLGATGMFVFTRTYYRIVKFYTLVQCNRSILIKCGAGNVALIATPGSAPQGILRGTRGSCKKIGSSCPAFYQWTYYTVYFVNIFVPGMPNVCVAIILIFLCCQIHLYLYSFRTKQPLPPVWLVRTSQWPFVRCVLPVQWSVVRWISLPWWYQFPRGSRCQ